MKKIIIGLVGFPGSGKTTVAKYLEEKGFFRVTLSDIIKEEAIKEGIQTFSREFLQEYGNVLRTTYGPQILAQRALEKIKNGNGEKIVVDGIRNIHEIRFLKQQDNFFLVALDSQPEERYQRLVAAKGREWTGSYENFLNQEEKEKKLGSEDVGIRVGECVNEATYRIKNFTSKEDLYRDIDAMINTIKRKEYNHVYRVVFLGVPGSGKGTQGKLLSQDLHIPRLSVGALIRRHFTDKTKEGIEVGEYMLRGEAIPAENYSRMVVPWLLRHQDGFVVDNLVRTQEQLNSFRQFQKKNAFSLTKVFYLHISEDEAKRRLSERKNTKERPDETEEAIHQRFMTFKKSIREIRDYFEQLGIFEAVNADRSAEDIHKDILQSLGL